MKEGQSSRTAEAAAALRANHFQNATNPVFSDPYAFTFTSAHWQKLLSTSWFTKLLNSPIANHSFGLLSAQVVGRSRYAEDLLLNSINYHVEQYVLVGAGLDSFALRQGTQLQNLTIFEVDHPDTQAVKQTKLKQLGKTPDNVEFVAINFEKESISDALARSHYQQQSAGFFSWLGTTHYLEPQTTLNTLSSIANFASSGSEVVLDYSIPYKELTGIERIGTLGVSQFTRLLQEPLIGQFKPAALHTAVKQMGFEVIEDLSGQDMNERYFNARADHIGHTAATHMLHLRLVK